MNRWIRLGEQFTRCGPCLLLLPCAGRADDRPGVERDADDRVVTGGREVWRMPSSSQHTVNPPSRASHQAQRSRRPDCVLIGRGEPVCGWDRPERGPGAGLSGGCAC